MNYTLKPGDEAAFPQTDQGEPIQDGLTKREYFAGLAMQGLLANRFVVENIIKEGGNNADLFLVERAAVSHADALLATLNKPVKESKK